MLFYFSSAPPKRQNLGVIYATAHQQLLFFCRVLTSQIVRPPLAANLLLGQNENFAVQKFCPDFFKLTFCVISFFCFYLEISDKTLHMVFFRKLKIQNVVFCS